MWEKIPTEIINGMINWSIPTYIIDRLEELWSMLVYFNKSYIGEKLEEFVIKEQGFEVIHAANDEEDKKIVEEITYLLDGYVWAITDIVEDNGEDNYFAATIYNLLPSK